MSTYYEQRYCNECVIVHWMEVTRAQRAICHGEAFYPHSSLTHYTRRLGRGIEVIEKQSYNLPIDWQMVVQERHETIDQDQDW